MKFIITCLITCLLVTTGLSQSVSLSGRVVDQATNTPLSGVLVKVVGAANSTATDGKGEYQLSLKDGYENITFSLAGYQTQKIYVGGQTTLDVALIKSSKEKETASTGFGSQSKSEVTSSISAIDNEEISNSPLINLEQANQGKTTGLFVQNTSGKLGEGTKVRIRGGSSLSASNQPLYVVDGVPLTSGNQSNINPSNIAKIEILKDASASALYGSRAANGVIIITTKSGGDGKVKIDADYQFGVSQSPTKLELYTPSEYNQQVIEFTMRILSLDEFVTKERLEEWEASGERELNLPDGSTLTLPSFYDSLNFDTDWQDEVFRTALSHRANLSLQGGTDKLGYFASMAYTTQEGILIGNKFNRLNGSLSPRQQNIRPAKSQPQPQLFLFKRFSSVRGSGSWGTTSGHCTSSLRWI